jgi:hypothetical protein
MGKMYLRKSGFLYTASSPRRPTGTHQKDGGEMQVSIVLDRPLAETKALMKDPDRLISEISKLVSNQSQWQAHPLLKWQIRM